jgi:hypothetical protein
MPNDPKLSDMPERRGTCTAGGPPARTRLSQPPEARPAGRGGNMATKAVAEAGAVTRRRVRCSAWLGDPGFVIGCGMLTAFRRPCELLRWGL